MSVFFYRPWMGSLDQNQSFALSQLYSTRWGYAALMGITLAFGFVANVIYLLGYISCPRAMFQVPHIAIVGLCIRDILVCLIIFPTAIDWLFTGFLEFNGGPVWCGIAVFFDFYLNALYPLLLISLATILYTRKLPPPRLPSREPSLRIPSSRMSGRSGYTQRTQQSQSQRTPGRAPSVVSTRTNQGNQPGQDFRRGFSKSVNGSVAGSDYGGSQVGRQRQQQYLSPMRGLPEEEYGGGPGGRAVSPVGSDLWESASLDYPGREDAPEFDPIDEYDDEPRLREWLRFLIPLSYLLALAFGIPAASTTVQEPFRNCFVKVEPYSTIRTYTSIITDSGTNIMLTSIILTYLAPVAILLYLCLLLCTTRWTKDGKLNRFYKMCIALSLFFVCVKSPIDGIQFQNLIEALKDNIAINRFSIFTQIEYEVLLIWSSLLPVVANPIIYFTCVSDYRVNIGEAWRIITRRNKTVESDYFVEAKETKESDVL